MTVLAVSLILIVVCVAWAVAALRIVPERQRAVVFRLGRFLAVRGPGLILVVPLVDRIVKVDLDPAALELSQDAVTRGNESVKVDAVIHYRILDPEKAVTAVSDFRSAMTQLAATALRTVVGRHEADTLVAKRESAAAELRDVIDAAAEAWGIKTAAAEVRHVDLKVLMRPRAADAAPR